MEKSPFAKLTRVIASGLLAFISDLFRALKASERHSYRISKRMVRFSTRLMGEEAYRRIRGDFKRSEAHEEFLKSEAALPVSRRILRERVDALLASFCALCLLATIALVASYVAWGGANWWMLLPPTVYFAAGALDVRLLEAGIRRGTYGASEFEAREVAAYVVADAAGDDGGDGGRNTRLFDAAVKGREAALAGAQAPQGA